MLLNSGVLVLKKIRIMLKSFTKNYLTSFLTVVITTACAFSARAQNPVITGKVTDVNGSPLPSTSVQIKNEKTTVITNSDGGYRITSPRILTERDSLIFKFIGYKSQTVGYNTSNIIHVQLTEDFNNINTVVVTALGIKRAEKALGYATQTITSQQMADAPTTNWTSALSGKVAGLNLLNSGSGPLNSTRIVLRGENSMNSNNNNALIVIDGVPVSSGGTSSGVSNAYGAGSGNDIPIDFGNGISDINPDDIESITVLKGASATALYGSRAANGAFIVNTKSGKKRERGIGLSFNSSTSFEDVLRQPDYQYEYGQGTGTTLTPASNLYYSYGASADGASTSGTSSAFGPRFNGQMYYQYDPVAQGQSSVRLPWLPFTDNRTAFWQTGKTFINSVSIDGGGDKVSARASVTHTKNDWIMPNTGFERLATALSLNYDASDRLSINAKVNFTNKSSDNLPGTGYNNQSIAYFMIFQNPNVDLNWYRPIWKKGMENVDQVHPFSSFIDNPYLIAYEMTNSINSYKTIGNLSATYKFNDKLNLMVRTGMDMVNEDRAQQRPFSTANFMSGYYKQQNIFNIEVNTDALLNYRTKLTKDINLSASAGANALNRKYTGVNGSVDGLIIPGVYKLSNGKSIPTMTTNYSRKKVHSVYGIASVDYKDRVFIDVTGRNDWSSTLPVENQSFFYPSVSSSFIISEIFKLPAAISYSKLRLSTAQVGNDTEPYKTRKYYGQSEFPGSGSVPTTLHNVDFKPEITTSYEAGLESRLLNSRLMFDVTLYRNSTKNQILDVPLDPTSGYTRAVLNAGTVRNQGVEVLLNAVPLKTQSFNWSSTLTWSKNSNKVLALAEGIEGKQDIGYGGNATIQARVGGTTGDIYGFGFLRSPEGEIIYTAAGLPARPTEIQFIGRAFADWKAGFHNEFTYKNYRFSVLLDGQYGGTVYSQSHHKMMEQGKLTSTLPGREDGFIIGEGVVRNPDGTFRPNTTKVAPATYYGDYYRRANVESNSFDASYLKLREIRIEYSFSKKLTQKLKINQLAVALYGRDLAMITNFPLFDPETAALNGSTLLPGIEMGQFPTPRTFGLNLTVRL